MKSFKCRMKKEGLGSDVRLCSHKNVNHKDKGQGFIPPHQHPLPSPKHPYSSPPHTGFLTKAKAYPLSNFPHHQIA